MSTPPATPTKPPAAPPAIVRLFARPTAVTLTDWKEPAPASSLTVTLAPMNALVIEPSTVTMTPPATPTKPPPTAGVSPKTSSLADAWTARPWKETSVPNPELEIVPSEMPLRPVTPSALASTWLFAPMDAWVFLLATPTPIAAPTPT